MPALSRAARNLCCAKWHASGYWSCSGIATARGQCGRVSSGSASSLVGRRADGRDIRALLVLLDRPELRRQTTGVVDPSRILRACIGNARADLRSLPGPCAPSSLERPVDVRRVIAAYPTGADCFMDFRCPVGLPTLLQMVRSSSVGSFASRQREPSDYWYRRKWGMLLPRVSIVQLLVLVTDGQLCSLSIVAMS